MNMQERDYTMSAKARGRIFRTSPSSVGSPSATTPADTFGTEYDDLDPQHLCAPALSVSLGLQEIAQEGSADKTSATQISPNRAAIAPSSSKHSHDPHKWVVPPTISAEFEAGDHAQKPINYQTVIEWKSAAFNSRVSRDDGSPTTALQVPLPTTVVPGAYLFSHNPEKGPWDPLQGMLGHITQKATYQYPASPSGPAITNASPRGTKRRSRSTEDVKCDSAKRCETRASAQPSEGCGLGATLRTGNPRHDRQEVPLQQVFGGRAVPDHESRGSYEPPAREKSLKAPTTRRSRKRPAVHQTAEKTLPYHSHPRVQDEGLVESQTLVAARLTPSPQPPGQNFQLWCARCRWGTNKSSTWNDHNARKHSHARPHICEVGDCRKSFKCVTDVVRHRKTHRDNPQCEGCGHQFAQPEAMTIHLCGKKNAGACILDWIDTGENLDLLVKRMGKSIEELHRLYDTRPLMQLTEARHARHA